MRKRGIERVHPLAGGFHEWKRLGYPLEPFFEKEGVSAD